MRIIVEFDETTPRSPDERDFEAITPRDVANFIEVALSGAKAIRQPVRVLVEEESDTFDADDVLDTVSCFLDSAGDQLAPVFAKLEEPALG